MMFAWSEAHRSKLINLDRIDAIEICKKPSLSFCMREEWPADETVQWGVIARMVGNTILLSVHASEFDAHKWADDFVRPANPIYLPQYNQAAVVYDDANRNSHTPGTFIQ